MSSEALSYLSTFQTIPEPQTMAINDDQHSFGKIDYQEAVEGLRQSFFRILQSRRQTPVFGDSTKRVTPVKPPKNTIYQVQLDPAKCDQAMLCGSSEERIFPESSDTMFEEEYLHLRTEAGDQGIVPMLILKLKAPDQQATEEEPRKPCVVFLHPSFKNKEWLRPLLKAYATQGYIAVGIDSRYHGERADSKDCYINALVSAWKQGDTFPFIYDTVWDLVKVMDYLSERKDVDAGRIGITGESLGGMHAWFAAAMDPRYTVAVPIIGVQSFKWAVVNNKWQGRVSSIPQVFEVAKEDLQKESIDAEIVASVWNKIAPGIIDDFDALQTIPAIAPRPLLILNGSEDSRCPIDGLNVCIAKTCDVYKQVGAEGNFKFIFAEGVGHCLTLSMVKEACKWFDKFLEPNQIRCDVKDLVFELSQNKEESPNCMSRTSSICGRQLSH